MILHLRYRDCRAIVLLNEYTNRYEWQLTDELSGTTWESTGSWATRESAIAEAQRQMQRIERKRSEAWCEHSRR